MEAQTTQQYAICVCLCAQVCRTFSFIRLFHPGGTITLRYISYTVVWYPLLSFLINTESRQFVCLEGPSLLRRFTIAITFRY